MAVLLFVRLNGDLEEEDMYFVTWKGFFKLINGKRRVMHYANVSGFFSCNHDARELETNRI